MPVKTRTAVALTSLLFLAMVSFGQQAATHQSDATTRPALDNRVADFQLIDGALIDGLAELTLQPIVGLHLGVEEIIRQRLSDPRDRSVRFSLRLENSTVRDILDTLCRYDTRYTWSTDGLSLNVYPRETSTDSSYLPNIWLEQVSVSNIPDPDQALTSLAILLPKQQIGYMQTGGDNRYAEPWTATFSRLTVRQFANRIAEHMGSRTAWVWQGGKDGRMFTFLKGGFHTRAGCENCPLPRRQSEAQSFFCLFALITDNSALDVYR